MVHGREETEKCPVYMVQRFGLFCVLLLVNDVVCKKHVNMCLCDVLTWKW